MRFSKDDIKKAMWGDPQCWKELAPVIRKCAASGARRSKAEAHVDDVEQELYLFLMKNYGRLDEDYNIEPYLIETARKISLAYKRKFAFFGTEGEDKRVDGIASLMGQEVASHEEAGTALVSKTDQDMALDYLMGKSSELRRASEQSKADNVNTQSTENGEKKTRKFHRTPEQTALRRIREEAGLTQIDMAARMGLKLPTYQSYEYGRTKSVRQDVMERARKISIKPEYSYIKALYGDQSMRDIALGWAKRMQIEPTGKALSEELNINKSNTSRWLNPNSKVQLTPNELLSYERKVKDIEEFKKSLAERHKKT